MSEKLRLFFKVEPTTGRVNYLKDKFLKAFNPDQVAELPKARQI